MRNIVYKRLLAASALGAAILSGVIVSSSLAADIEPYQRIDALKTIMNPHEQISDEGEILWGTCIICHRDVPDPRKEKSIIHKGHKAPL
ncbi:MAG: hypothetical protein HZB83_06625 [Deltaproteobacteria bacterium]|nr:hypothetical protein [Deltaproteobacteria bacterium]